MTSRTLYLKETHTRFWDGMAERNKGYAKVLPSNMTDEEVEEETERAISIIRDFCKSGAKVLDAGCGVGRADGKLQDCGYSTVGLDLSAKMVEYARENNPNVDFVVGDIANMPFKDGSFDLVFELSVLLHQPNERVGQMLEEFKRVSREGILIFPNAKPFKTSVYCFYRPLGFYEESLVPFEKVKEVEVDSKWGSAVAMLFSKI